MPHQWKVAYFLDIWYNNAMIKDTDSKTRTTETVTISSAEYERLKHQNEWLEGRVRWLEEQLKVLAKNHFGSKHESASEEVIGQMAILFNEPEVYAYLEEIKQAGTATPEQKPKKKAERVFMLDKLPKGTEVIAEKHELSEEERKCPVCGSVLWLLKWLLQEKTGSRHYCLKTSRLSAKPGSRCAVIFDAYESAVRKSRPGGIKFGSSCKSSGVSSMEDIQNLFKETIAEFMENGLDAELDDELGYSKYDYKNKDTDNSRNGHSSKTLRTSFGDVEVSVPRDRKGEFEPQILKKNQTSISQDIEEKILSMYAKGMTTLDIEAHIRDVYGVEVSDTTVSRITDKILPVAKEWQQRPLDAVYAVVFLDAIHYHVRSDGQVVKKAVYIAIGINLDGRKDVLGMWVGENESAKFWATVLNGLKNRGVEDIFIACTDNLTGFSSAIEAVYPKTEIQNCIIHQLRNSSKYVSYKDLKALMADLKAVYAAVDEPAALDALDAFSERWDRKYPKISQSWRNNWANLSTYFKYPQEVRKLIYTTNTIEGFNRQLRKVTKSKSVFPTDDSLLKMLYLAMMDITKKWTGRRQDWSVIYAQLAIFFGDRIAE